MCDSLLDPLKLLVPSDSAIPIFPNSPLLSGKDERAIICSSQSMSIMWSPLRMLPVFEYCEKEDLTLVVEIFLVTLNFSKSSLS